MPQRVAAPMNTDLSTPTPEPGAVGPVASFSPGMLLLLGAWLGLVGGFLDLGMIFLKRDVFHATLYYEQGRHFRWIVPLASLAVLMVPTLLLAGIRTLRPAWAPPRLAAWLLTTLALWGPFLRAPLFGLASLALAAGLARALSGAIVRHPASFRRFAILSLAALFGIVGTVAASTLRHWRAAESAALARLPEPPPGARNVLLIVMDTVRAASLGLYGYGRDTTPRLQEWARRGVLFERAIATAPWTFPSHCSMMTGQWPSTLNAHWRPTTDPAYPTLAEFLSARGLLTLGFAANTNWCSYESGMDRGFVHYEDYPLAPARSLRSTMPGRWLLENVVHRGDPYQAKWVRSQSREARGVNAAFLDRLGRTPSGERPFFAFLNYLDAHEPFVPPADAPTRFGLQPANAAEWRMLLDYWDLDKLALTARDVELARDAYDTCIAALDREVGDLLDELERRGILRDTLVIVTSDHGEQFGEHGVFNHGFSLYANEIHVPLLVLGPGVPAGTRVYEPVSLRDLPATIVETLGLTEASPFPGRSLARAWSSAPGQESASGDVLSEVDIPQVITPHRGRGPNQRGFTLSLLAEGLHYLMDMRGVEELYALEDDPAELRNRKEEPARLPALERFRVALGGILRGARLSGPPATGYRQQFLQVLGSLSGPPKL